MQLDGGVKQNRISPEDNKQEGLTSLESIV